MKLKINRKAQSTLEYAIIVVVVVGALLAMQWYVKGGFQGRLRQASDDMGQQFSPTLTASNQTTNINSSQTEAWGGGSYSTNTPSSNTITSNVTQARTGSENVSGLTPIPGDQR
jgi:uncharacterized protein (UPF0333 family)